MGKSDGSPEGRLLDGLVEGNAVGSDEGAVDGETVIDDSLDGRRVCASTTVKDFNTTE